MGSLVRDGQSNVRRFFVRLNVYSDFQVPENRDKSTVQKWVKNGSRESNHDGSKTTKCPFYRQIVIRKTAKKGVQIDLQNGEQKYGPKHVQGEGAQELL
jgi:hypothetical protein